jgi:2-polyprenyl-3-methyl-5-hydroxy-6-metoxy-1,4-benzoquinol methylase
MAPRYAAAFHSFQQQSSKTQFCLGLGCATIIMLLGFFWGSLNATLQNAATPGMVQVITAASDGGHLYVDELDLDTCPPPAWEFGSYNSCILDDFQLAEKPVVPRGWNKRLISRMCTFSQMITHSYNRTAAIFKEKPAFHRKQWEFVYIYNTLLQAGVLKPGKVGMGFGCGSEPLPAAYARLGAKVIATDLAPELAGDWSKSSQWTVDVSQLNERSICPEQQFKELVRHEYQNMNELPYEQYESKLDFVWSSCAIEHVGSLEKSKAFLTNVMRLLKPGGISIHTTEFNLSDLDYTIEEGSSIVFRKKDILEVREDLIRMGHHPAPIDFRSGCSWVDNYIDAPPYAANPVHLKLLLQEVTSTSIGLITIKGTGKVH